MARALISSQMQDKRLLGRLRHAIEADGRVPRLDIDVDVEDGVIELLGVIPDEREHEALLALVEGAGGKSRVVDHLIVQSGTYSH